MQPVGVVFQNIGLDGFCSNHDFMNGLESFVCCLYGKNKYTDINKARHDIFKSRYDAKSKESSFSTQEGIDLSLLPPCQASLHMHIERVNYQTTIWKQAHVAAPNVPSPVGCGWKMEDGCLSVDWIKGDMMPQQLADVLDDNNTTESGERTTAEMDLEPEYEFFENEIEEDDEIENMLDIIFEDDQDD